MEEIGVWCFRFFFMCVIALIISQFQFQRVKEKLKMPKLTRSKLAVFYGVLALIFLVLHLVL